MTGALPFSCVPHDHPVYPDVERFWELARDDPSYSRLAAEGLYVRSLLRARLVRGAWEFRRLYVSFQSPGGAPAFAAHTFLYSAERGLRRYDFPADPALTTLGSMPRDGVRVLRYVPRRRVTFAATGAVGKAMRALELDQAYANLFRVTRKPLSGAFEVARPLGIDRTRGVYFQETLDGTPVSSLVDERNVSELMADVGAVHREIHGLHVDGIPVWNGVAFLRKVAYNVEWLASMLPAQESLIREVHGVLLRSLPRFDVRRFALCHGDFRTSHLLRSGGRYAVVDWDGCVRADPHLEVATLLAFAQSDVPVLRDDLALHEAACEAYLEGYGRLDRRRLAWYRLCAELHFLTRSIQRDLLSPEVCERGIAAIEALLRHVRPATRALSVSAR